MHHITKAKVFTRTDILIIFLCLNFCTKIRPFWFFGHPVCLEWSCNFLVYPFLNKGTTNIHHITQAKLFMRLDILIISISGIQKIHFRDSLSKWKSKTIFLKKCPQKHFKILARHFLDHGGTFEPNGISDTLRKTYTLLRISVPYRFILISVLV